VKSLEADMSFIKRIFTWWNGSTFGTLLSLRGATKVGEDDYGNTYYEDKSKTLDGRPRRYVTYKGYADPSRVPPEWHGWLHHSYDDLPKDMGIKIHAWQKEHLPNLTGTVHAYKPKGSLDRGGERAKVTSDYEAWSPDA